MRELADWQPDQYERVLCWPLREALIAFEQRLKRDARESYRWELLTHSAIAPHLKEAKDRKPPKMPDILTD